SPTGRLHRLAEPLGPGELCGQGEAQYQQTTGSEDCRSGSPGQLPGMNLVHDLANIGRAAEVGNR
ncbi:MAG: hypothetical protein ACYSUQ_01405, partial [Planctomycetota bacterium]